MLNVTGILVSIISHVCASKREENLNKCELTCVGVFPLACFWLKNAVFHELPLFPKHVFITKTETTENVQLMYQFINTVFFSQTFRHT